MPGTRINQVREIIAFDDGTRYRVAATCVLAGTLPDVFIFVKQVNDEADPKDDVFVRICAPGDFTALYNDREEAIQAGAYENGRLLYRSAELVKVYDDASVAYNAWLEVFGRINTLVTDYDVFVSTFLTSPEGSITTFPAADAGLVKAKEDAYLASLAVVTAAEQVRDVESTACQALRLELQSLEAQLTATTDDVRALTPIVGDLAGLPGTYRGIEGALEAAAVSAGANVTSSDAGASWKATLTSSVAAVSTQVDRLEPVTAVLDAGVYAPLTALLGSLQAREAQLRGEVTAAAARAASCAATTARLQGNVDAARGARDAALAELRAVCPDYTLPQ